MLVSVGALSAIALSADQPLTYLVFAGLIWAALRFGPQGATLAVAVAVVEAVVLTANERGPFVVHAVNDTALNLQLYIIVAALITQCLTVIVSERRRGALELAESRMRIATAAAAERRRLSDELHDSAQNRLVGLLIRLQLAQEDVAQASPSAAAKLDRLVDEAVSVADDLRRIAHGLSPPLLEAQGLAAALADETKHSGIAVRVVAEKTGVSDPEIEREVYLACLESIQNAAKHAGRDAAVTLSLRSADNELQFSIRDTGRGFDPQKTTGARA